MEIAFYKNLFRNYWKTMVAVTLLVVALVWVGTLTQKPNYEGSVFITTAQPPEEAVSGQTYQFDQFYTIQGSSFVTKQLAAWLQDPATVEGIFKQAGYVLAPDQTLKKIGRTFDQELKGETGVQVRFNHADQDRVVKVLKALTAQTQTTLANLQSRGFYQDFTIIPGEVFVHQAPSSLNTSLFLGALAGIILGFVISLFWALVSLEQK